MVQDILKFKINCLKVQILRGPYFMQHERGNDIMTIYR